MVLGGDQDVLNAERPVGERGRVPGTGDLASAVRHGGRVMRLPAAGCGEDGRWREMHLHTPPSQEGDLASTELDKNLVKCGG